jgi:hypothetical protein
VLGKVQSAGHIQALATHVLVHLEGSVDFPGRQVFR